MLHKVSQVIQQFPDHVMGPVLPDSKPIKVIKVKESIYQYPPAT